MRIGPQGFLNDPNGVLVGSVVAEPHVEICRPHSDFEIERPRTGGVIEMPRDGVEAYFIPERMAEFLFGVEGKTGI